MAVGSEETAKPAPQRPPTAEADAHKEDANTVEVDEGMLRDLRITTRAVESRTGGELVMLWASSRWTSAPTPKSARLWRRESRDCWSMRATPCVSGQTLAELTSPELGRERAEYLSASARLKLAEAALERKRGLAAEKIVPLREVQEAESAAGEARAALRASRAAIAAFGVEPPTDDGDGATSSAFVLRSPVAGSVIERTAVVGQMLDPAAPAFRIGNLSTLWLTVHAFERDAVRIQQGVSGAAVVSRSPRTGLRRHGDDGRTSRRARVAHGPSQN